MGAVLGESASGVVVVADRGGVGGTDGRVGVGVCGGCGHLAGPEAAETFPVVLCSEGESCRSLATFIMKRKQRRTGTGTSIAHGKIYRFVST